MTDYPSLHMIIGGEKISGGGRRTFDVVNPATGETIGALPLAEPRRSNARPCCRVRRD